MVGREIGTVLVTGASAGDWEGYLSASGGEGVHGCGDESGVGEAWGVVR